VTGEVRRGECKENGERSKPLFDLGPISLKKKKKNRGGEGSRRFKEPGRTGGPERGTKAEGEKK